MHSLPIKGKEMQGAMIQKLVERSTKAEKESCSQEGTK